MNNSRERILKKIRKATATPSALPTLPENTDLEFKNKLDESTPKNADTLLEQYKNELKALSAEFHLIDNADDALPIIKSILTESEYSKLVFSDNETCEDIANQIKQQSEGLSCIKATDLPYPKRKTELAVIPASLVKASFAVADIGSLVFPYDDNGTTLPHFLSDCVFVLVNRKNLYANQFELFKQINPEKAKNMVFVAGPSRTADIEKVLVLGAHGPRRLVVFMINNR